MGTSAQNFIDLLFGGVNKGLDVARQQQGQQVDLALTIQQMLAQQKARQAEAEHASKVFEYQKAKDTADRMTKAGEKYYDMLFKSGEAQRDLIKTRAIATGSGKMPAPIIQEHDRMVASGYKGTVKDYYNETRAGGLLNAAALARHRADYAKLVTEYAEHQTKRTALKRAGMEIPDLPAPPATFDEYLGQTIQAGIGAMNDKDLRAILLNALGDNAIPD